MGCPENPWLTFIHFPNYVDDVRRLRFTLEDQRALEMAILENPAAAPVARGTGGLRKLRFAPPSWNRGKRGGARVCYVHFAQFGTIGLFAAYEKNRQEDLSPDERRTMRALIWALENDLME